MLSKLPEDRIRAVKDFADFVYKKYEEEILQKGMEQLSSESQALNFLREEEELYSEKDLKKKF